MEHSIPKRALESVLPAASRDETRYNLNGVRFTPNAVETTDGYRLHRVTFAEPIGDGERTVHIDSVVAAVKAHGKVREPMNLNGSWKVGEGVSLPAKECEGEWPNTNQVVPKAATHRITLNAQFLRDACDAAIKIQAGARSPHVVLDFNPEDLLGPLRVVATPALPNDEPAYTFLAVIMPMRI